MSAPSRRRPGGPPASVGVLAKDVQSYARASGVAEGRVRAWVAHMALTGMLERCARAAKHSGGPKNYAVADLALTLERAIATDAGDAQTAATGTLGGHPGYQGFQFQRRREPIVLDNGTVNVELATTYRGGAWTTISVDIAGPARVPCLPLRFQIAQKLHGMTLPPRQGQRNDRFKDLIDLVLMEALVSDYTGLREACEQLFEDRAKHTWPPPLELPEHWPEGYAKLAKDLELSATSAAEAMERVRAMVARIQAAS